MSPGLTPFNNLVVIDFTRTKPFWLEGKTLLIRQREVISIAIVVSMRFGEVDVREMGL